MHPVFLRVGIFFLILQAGNIAALCNGCLLEQLFFYLFTAGADLPLAEFVFIDGLLEQEQAVAEAGRRAILESPLVKAAFAAFPEAELLDSDESESQWSKRA